MRPLRRVLHKIGVQKDRLYRAFASARDREALVRKLGRGVWVLNTAAVDQGGIAITGWIAASDKEAQVDVLVNGTPCQSIAYGGTTTQLQQILPYHEMARHLGFHGWAPISPAADFAEVSVIDRRAGLPLGEWQSMFVPLKTDLYPVPDARRRMRVHGSPDEETFRLTGLSNFQKLNKAATQIAGRRLDGFAHVLDWGCGCGRLTRSC